MTHNPSTSTRAGGTRIGVERTITVNDTPFSEFYLLRQLQPSLHSLLALPLEPGKCRFLPLRNRLLYLNGILGRIQNPHLRKLTCRLKKMRESTMASSNPSDGRESCLET
jgi:hypothetical protein